MAPIVRFAPSPTGRLHVGNIRTAVLNWLFAKKHGGTFILRLDDTDVARSTEEFANGIREDLAWLGLDWAREERQTARTARYEEVAERLKASGHFYPCFESEDELQLRRKVQLGRGLPPIYDRAALRLSTEDRAQLIAEGRRPHWRFRLPNTTGPGDLVPKSSHVTWHDIVRGEQSVDLGSLSDPVLIREDGTFLYTFTSVVDDADFGVTHIVRGEDHVTNTGVQLALFSAIGATPPAFAHHSLLVGVDGQALSKRDRTLSIEVMRTDGFEALAIVAYAALVGTSEAIEPRTSLADLAERLDLGRLSRAPGRFDPHELLGLNARTLHLLSYAAVEKRLEKLGIGGGEAFWSAVRGNLSKLADAADWWRVVSGTITPVVENAALCAAAEGLLPPEPWNETTWAAWTDAVKAASGIKGKALFHPLRLALTGREQGPELKVLLPLIGRERAAARLRGTSG